MSHNSHTPANQLFPELLAGFDVNIKNINWDDPKYNILYDPNDPIWNKVKKLGVEELTDGTIGGTGIFDGLMVSVEAHLLKEYKANRITGAEYTQAYVALVQSAMGQAVSYVTASEQQFWASVAARVAAINGIVELENVKLKYEVLKIEAMKGKAEYALNKQRLAIEDTNFAIAEYHLTNIHPAQYAGLLLDNTGKGIANDTALYNLNTILPTQHAGMLIANATAQYNLDYIMVEQYKGLQWDNATKKYNLEKIMVAQYDGMLIANATAQFNLDFILDETWKGLKWDNATKKYNLENIMVAQYDGMLIANATAQYNLDYIMVEQYKGLVWDNATKKYNLENIMVAQYDGMLIVNETAQYHLDNTIVAQYKGILLDNATKQYNLDYILVETWKGLKWDNSTKQYNLEKILVATYDGMLIDNATKQYNLDNILVAQYDGMLIANETAQYHLDNTIVAQYEGILLDNATKQYNLDNILVATYNGLLLDNATKQYNLDKILVETYNGLVLDNATKQYTLSNILPEQKILIMEQGNVQRAHTKIDRRNDGGGISAIDKQSTAYMQNWLHWVQSSAFVRDNHIKAAKVFADVYAVLRTTDEDIQPPAGMDTTSTTAAFNRLKMYMDENVGDQWHNIP